MSNISPHPASLSGARALVTGADGFIGSHLAEALLRAGADVTAMSLYTAGDSHGWLDSLDPTVRGGMRLVRGDVRDPGFMLRICQGQEVIFHLAALIAIPFSYEAGQSYVDVNVTGTLNVLEAARTHGARRIVHTSTSEVYGTAQATPIDESHPIEAQSPYAASKVGADMMAKAYAKSFELPVVVLRPFNTYGPRQSERAVISSTIRQALDPDCAEIRMGDVSTRRDFTFVGDTVRAFIAAATTDGLAYGDPYNAGSGRSITIAETVDAIRAAAATGKPAVTEAVRFRPEASEVRILEADSGRFHAATGWVAGTSLENGIAETVRWWQTRLQAGTVRPDAGYLR